MNPSPYALGHDDGHEAFRATGLPVPPADWAESLLSLLGRDGAGAFLGLAEDADEGSFGAALADYVRGCRHGFADAQRDRHLSDEP